MMAIVRIGARASPLARAQAEEVRTLLAEAHPELAEPGAIAVEAIKTTGDRVGERPLADIGGKGLFTKEIEEALLAGVIDIAVHSMKDVPTWLPEGLVIACLPAREDPRDVLVANGAAAIAELPVGTVVGTASLRRKAQLLMARRDLEVVPLRGNVQTRLRKLAAGKVGATLLALAGLKRLGLDGKVDAIALDPSEMLPAVGQGAIGIECRTEDTRMHALLAPLNHVPTAVAVDAERALLSELDGSCRTPIAALAEFDGAEILSLRALLAKPDGSAAHTVSRRGSVADAAALGADAGRELRALAGPGFLDGDS